eukprot:2148609-Pyramimonas_sp.AAC.1
MAIKIWRQTRRVSHVLQIFKRVPRERARQRFVKRNEGAGDQFCPPAFPNVLRHMVKLKAF